ncbi:hypothetical protein QBC47DRAFT_173138 [Echria macrotheca]|uniref:Uncharacterized protein n=1 Tax=Echria macrotheca TaxID=438768 RepID=A0AAJ0F7K2_9PEZI|nr:hypothetical protein QBC47DRAFT_173138 [Echria macrotheca]
MMAIQIPEEELPPPPPETASPSPTHHSSAGQDPSCSDNITTTRHHDHHPSHLVTTLEQHYDIESQSSIPPLTKRIFSLLLKSLAPIALILSCIALWPTLASALDAHRQTALAEWTSAKDFLEYCESRRTSSSSSGAAAGVAAAAACKGVWESNRTLDAPPGFFDPEGHSTKRRRWWKSRSGGGECVWGNWNPAMGVVIEILERALHRVVMIRLGVLFGGGDDEDTLGFGGGGLGLFILFLVVTPWALWEILAALYSSWSAGSDTLTNSAQCLPLRSSPATRQHILSSSRTASWNTAGRTAATGTGTSSTIRSRAEAKRRRRRHSHLATVNSSNASPSVYYDGDTSGDDNQTPFNHKSKTLSPGLKRRRARTFHRSGW